MGLKAVHPADFEPINIAPAGFEAVYLPCPSRFQSHLRCPSLFQTPYPVVFEVSYYLSPVINQEGVDEQIAILGGKVSDRNFLSSRDGICIKYRNKAGVRKRYNTIPLLNNGGLLLAYNAMHLYPYSVFLYLLQVHHRKKCFVKATKNW